MEDILKWGAENYGTILSAGTMFFGIVVFCRKWITNAIRGINLSVRVHDIFGDSPAEKLKAVHDAITKSCSIFEIRQSIIENHLQMGIYFCDSETGHCFWTNEYLNELFGLDSQAMKDFGWMRSIHEDDRDRVHRVWIDALKDRTPYLCRYRLVSHRSGIEKKVETYAIAVMDDNKKILFYVGYVCEQK